jgi:hypothetical protein
MESEVKKVKDSIKKEVRAMWLMDKPLKQIARDFDISPKTISAWVTKYKWIEEREQLNKKADELLVGKLHKKMLHTAELYFNLAEAIAEVAMCNVGDIEKLGETAKAALAGAKILQTVCPNFVEQLNRYNQAEVANLKSDYDI